METILVVDDNRQISDFLVKTALPSLGYETMAAYNGKDALKLIREQYKFIDLMLLDLQLPDMTGLDILRQMQREGLSIPTILVTGHGSEQVAVDAFRLGVQDYLNKPVEVDKLNVSIESALTLTRLRREAERLNAQLREQVNWLTTLSQVGQTLTSTLDVSDVLKRIVDAGVRLTKADEGFLALLDETSGQLYLRAVKNIDENVIHTIHLPITDSLTGQTLRSGKPLRVTRGESDPLKVSTGFLVYSLLHIPLISKNVPLGILSVDNRMTRRAFSATDEAMLTSLADYAIAAIENANLYEKAQQEIQERKRVELALRESEERYALAVRGANDGLWDWNLKTRRIYFSSRWKDMLGYAEDEIGDTPDEWFRLVHPDDLQKLKKDLNAHITGQTSHFENQHRIRHENGTYRWVLSRGFAIRAHQRPAHRMAGSQTDITDRELAQQKLRYDALHDVLTGVSNRASLMERLKLALEKSYRRSTYSFAVLFLDLDRFKDVNDSLGHLMGDQLVIAAARILEKIVRPMDLVARLGGDEFVILVEDIHDVIDATQVAKRVQTELNNTEMLPGQKLHITASIGIVIGSKAYRDPEDLLRDADIAMYRAKEAGRDRFELFDPEMRKNIMQRLAMEIDLRSALDNAELKLLYQPIVSLQNSADISGNSDLSGKSLVGFEALLRWVTPNQGTLLPKDFLPLAEKTGLIVNIDQWVLAAATRQMKEWQGNYPIAKTLQMSVNISGRQLSRPDLVDEIDSALQKTGLSPSSLSLEVTESELMKKDPETTSVLQKLQQQGMQILVDDFGFGYSSLSYVSGFPLNALKIDRSFISTLDSSNTNLRIVQAIMVMARGLGMKVVAVGIENEKQLHKLQGMGCEFVQGFFIAPPLEKEQVQKLLENA